MDTLGFGGGLELMVISDPVKSFRAFKSLCSINWPLCFKTSVEIKAVISCFSDWVKSRLHFLNHLMRNKQILEVINWGFEERIKASACFSLSLCQNSCGETNDL